MWGGGDGQSSKHLLKDLHALEEAFIFMRIDVHAVNFTLNLAPEPGTGYVPVLQISQYTYRQIDR